MFSGSIGIFMAHSKTLNTTEIAQNWNNLKSRYGL
jgi:hypothetical protein